MLHSDVLSWKTDIVVIMWTYFKNAVNSNSGYVSILGGNCFPYNIVSGKVPFISRSIWIHAIHWLQHLLYYIYMLLFWWYIGRSLTRSEGKLIVCLHCHVNQYSHRGSCHSTSLCTYRHQKHGECHDVAVHVFTVHWAKPINNASCENTLFLLL